MAKFDKQIILKLKIKSEVCVCERERLLDTDVLKRLIERVTQKWNLLLTSFTNNKTSCKSELLFVPSLVYLLVNKTTTGKINKTSLTLCHKIAFQ